MARGKQSKDEKGGKRSANSRCKFVVFAEHWQNGGVKNNECMYVINSDRFSVSVSLRGSGLRVLCA